jgi:hypothetical protein
MKCPKCNSRMQDRGDWHGCIICGKAALKEIKSVQALEKTPGIILLRTAADVTAVVKENFTAIAAMVNGGKAWCTIGDHFGCIPHMMHSSFDRLKLAVDAAAWLMLPTTPNVPGDTCVACGIGDRGPRGVCNSCVAKLSYNREWLVSAGYLPKKPACSYCGKPSYIRRWSDRACSVCVERLRREKRRGDR